MMPAAISMGITAVCRINDSQTIRVYSSVFEEPVSINIAEKPEAQPRHWSNFLIGVIRHLMDNGISVCGCDILFDSNLPLGSGLSSSAAMEVLCYYMLYKNSTGDEPDKLQMAIDCQKIENDFIGVSCGIMDQFAVVFGKKDHAIVLDCGILDHTYAPLILRDHSLLIIDTKKPRALADSAYNDRKRECDEALNIIRAKKTIDNLVEADPTDLELIKDPVLKRRAKHVISEQKRVLASQKALSISDLKAFGELMYDSHQSLRDYYEVSCGELDHLVNFSQQFEGCIGSRMTGAGFGGCCIAIVKSARVSSFETSIKESYFRKFGIYPTVFPCQISSGVQLVTR